MIHTFQINDGEQRAAFPLTCVNQLLRMNPTFRYVHDARDAASLYKCFGSIDFKSGGSFISQPSPLWQSVPAVSASVICQSGVTLSIYHLITSSSESRWNMAELALAMNVFQGLVS